MGRSSTPFPQTSLGAVVLAVIAGLILLVAQQYLFSEAPPSVASIEQRESQGGVVPAKEVANTPVEAVEDELAKKNRLDEAKRKAELEDERRQVAAEIALQDAKKRRAELERQELAEQQAEKDRQLANAKARFDSNMSEGKLVSFAGLRIRLNYDGGRDSARVGRRIKNLLHGLSGVVVGPGLPFDLAFEVQTTLAIDEKIGNRIAEYTVVVSCQIPSLNRPCFEGPTKVGGHGEGPNFEVAKELAVVEAMRNLE